MSDYLHHHVQPLLIEANIKRFEKRLSDTRDEEEKKAIHHEYTAFLKEKIVLLLSYVKSPNQQVLSFSPRSDETIHHH